MTAARWFSIALSLAVVIAAAVALVLVFSGPRSAKRADTALGFLTAAVLMRVVGIGIDLLTGRSMGLIVVATFNMVVLTVALLVTVAVARRRHDAEVRRARRERRPS